MKRRSLFAALAGAVGLKAQEATYSICPPECPTRKNGQCPVCGTTAPKRYRPTEKLFKNCRPYPSDGSIMVCDSEDVPHGDKERIVRCANCSAAFWQDAEE